jgi:hypothetical protein
MAHMSIAISEPHEFPSPNFTQLAVVLYYLLPWNRNDLLAKKKRNRKIIKREETIILIIKDRQQSRLTKIKWFFMRTYDALVLPVFQHRNTSTLLVEQGGRHKFGKIFS